MPAPKNVTQTESLVETGDKELPPPEPIVLNITNRTKPEGHVIYNPSGSTLHPPLKAASDGLSDVPDPRFSNFTDLMYSEDSPFEAAMMRL